MMVFITLFCRVIVFDYFDNCLVIIVITLPKVIVLDYIGQVIATRCPPNPSVQTILSLGIGFVIIYLGGDQYWRS